MNKFLLCVLSAALLLSACGGKSKKKMSGEETITAEDFIEFFDEIKLPLMLTDSSLQQKNNDSALISNTVFKQFVSDTVLSELYGKDAPQIYALGRFRNKDQETYLLLKTKGGKPAMNAVYALAFNPKDSFSASMLLLSDSKKANEINRVTIDPRFTFTLVDEYKDADGSIEAYSAVYAYNNAGLFMIILKDGLQKGEIKPILNPIDTLPAQSKFSGNYGKDDRNFISIRDGKTPQDFVFFINFDKGAKSDCQGELKGVASFITKDSAMYHDKGDPCTIGFKFGGKSVRITEMVVCGNKRPADCTFNANYTRQKEAVTEKKETTKPKGKSKK